MKILILCLSMLVSGLFFASCGIEEVQPLATDEPVDPTDELKEDPPLW